MFCQAFKGSGYYLGIILDCERLLLCFGSGHDMYSFLRNFPAKRKLSEILEEITAGLLSV